MLAHIFSEEEYALALAPGFCRFYAHIGVLDALHEAKFLNVTHLTGCSAGALVSAFLSTGMDPPEMAQRVLAIQRSDIWDVGGIGGLLKGNLFREKISENLLVQEFKDTKIPLAMTAFDLMRLKTNCIVSGNIAAATRASCTFPGLFQPILIDGRPHIDGGVWDHDGLLSLEACFREQQRREHPQLSAAQLQALPLRDIVPANKLIVNVTFDFLGFSKLPAGLEHCRLLSLVLRDVPGVTPFSMHDMGPRALRVAKAATALALRSAHMMELAPNHWCCYIDAKRVTDDMLEGSKMPMLPPLVRASSAESSGSGNSNSDSNGNGNGNGNSSGRGDEPAVCSAAYAAGSGGGAGAGAGSVVEGVVALHRASSLTSVSTVVYEAEDAASGRVSCQVLEVEDSALPELLAHPERILALRGAGAGDGSAAAGFAQRALDAEEPVDAGEADGSARELDLQQQGTRVESSASSTPSPLPSSSSASATPGDAANHVPFQEALRTPSFSFINGSYFFYQAAGDSLASSSSFLRSLTGVDASASDVEESSRKRSISSAAHLDNSGKKARLD